MFAAGNRFAQVGRRGPRLPSALDLRAAEGEHVGRVDAEAADVEPGVVRIRIARRMQGRAGERALFEAALRECRELLARERTEAREVDGAEAEHHRRGLQLLAFAQVQEARAGTVERVDVTGRVDQNPRLHGHDAALGQQAHGRDALTAARHIQQVRMQQRLHARVAHHVVQHQLEHFGRVFDAVHAVARGHREHLVLTGGAVAPQAIDHLGRHAGDDPAARGRLPAVELRDGAAGGIAAQEAIALDQQHLRTLASCRDRGHGAGQSAAADEDVRLHGSACLVAGCGHVHSALMPRALITAA